MSRDRIAHLRDLLSSNAKLTSRADEIIEVVRGKEAMRHGTAVDVQRAEGKRAPNGEEYHIRISASTDTICRDGGIIPVNAWEKGGLRNFNKNPIILFGHSHQAPIGRSVFTDLDQEKLNEYWLFHDESDISKLMHKLYDRGFMRAASVGFIINEWAFIDELEDGEMASLIDKYGRQAMKECYWIARAAELLETSAVPVPSDPNALAFSYATSNARAAGEDISAIESLIPKRSTAMPTPATPTATPTAPAAKVRCMIEHCADDMHDHTGVERKPENEVVTRAQLDAAVAAVKTEFEARLAKLEQARATETPVAPATTSTTATPTTDTRSTPIDGNLNIEIEVRDGETEEQALDRYLDTMIATKRGAPTPRAK